MNRIYTIRPREDGSWDIYRSGQIVQTASSERQARFHAYLNGGVVVVGTLRMTGKP